MTCAGPGRLLCVTLAVFLGTMPVNSMAQQVAPQGSGQVFEGVENWLPNDFQITCGAKSGPFRPDPLDTSCIANDQARIDYEVYAWLAATHYKAGGFSSPYHFGPVIDAYLSPGRTIRVYTDAVGDAAAHVSPQAAGLADWCDREGHRLMAVNPSAIAKYPASVNAFVAAHELFHTVQAAIPGAYMRNDHRRARCYPPKWIKESQADAAAIDFMRREFPETFPPRPKQIFGFNIAGLRPYYVPLNYQHSATDYDTNSFWLYLGDRFHESDFKFLEDYAWIPAPTYGGDVEDWLRWLDERLQEDARIAMPLYQAYPDFLTSFAGQWAKGGIGEKFGRKVWLSRAFYRCYRAIVSPQAPYVEILSSVRWLAGACLTVTVKGLGAADLAAVKIGAFTDDEQLADSLHLGFAFTNDQTGFNCAELMRSFQPAPGTTACLFEPVTGILETGADSRNAARMWHALALEKGAGSQSRGRKRQEIENVYILSYVPTEPWEQFEDKASGREATQVRLGIGLEWATLGVSGQNANQGAADGKRAVKRRRAAAAMGTQPVETDMFVPASYGYVDLGPMAEIFGRETVGMATALSETLKQTDALWGGIGGKYKASLFRLGEVEATPAGIIGETLEVLREFDVLIENGLPEGVTGTFEAFLYGWDKARPHVAFASPEGAPATATVVENSHGAFRASVRGQVCAVDFAAIQAGARPDCADPFPVEGEIVKPFAYLYRPSIALHSIETEGEELYNRQRAIYTGPARPHLNARADETGGGSTGPAPPADGKGSGGATMCSCACPDHAVPATKSCRVQCRQQLSACSAASPQSPPSPPEPTLEAQVKWFARLLSGHGISPEVEAMLVEDFATMSPETRAYLIRKYR